MFDRRFQMASFRNTEPARVMRTDHWSGKHFDHYLLFQSCNPEADDGRQGHKQFVGCLSQVLSTEMKTSNIRKSMKIFQSITKPNLNPNLRFLSSEI